MSMNPHDSSDQSVSRRDLIKHGAAAVVGGAILGGAPALAQAPAVVTGTKSMSGTKFRALIRRPPQNGVGQNTTVETLTLRAIQPHEVVIRTQAAQACY